MQARGQLATIQGELSVGSHRYSLAILVIGSESASVCQHGLCGCHWILNIVDRIALLLLAFLTNGTSIHRCLHFFGRLISGVDEVVRV